MGTSFFLKSPSKIGLQFNFAINSLANLCVQKSHSFLIYGHRPEKIVVLGLSV